jgi:ABC-type nitrate/sulfonate/bicarbonate transport system permease component
VGLLLWQITSFYVGKSYFPSFWPVGKEVLLLIQKPVLWHEILLTLAILLISLIISLILSLILQFLFNFLQPLNDLLYPLIVFIRSVPTIVIFPLLVVMLGVSLQTEILLISIGTTLKLLLFMQESKSKITVEQIEYVRITKIGKFREYINLRLPVSIFSILVGLRYVLNIAFGTIVALGILVGAPGLGNGLFIAENSGNTTQVFAYVLIMGMAGILINNFMNILEYSLRVYLRVILT